MFLEILYRIYSTAGYNIAHVDVTAALCQRDHIRPEDVDWVECVVNWLETQYPSPAFPSRRTDTDAAREQPQYYAAHAILTGSFPITKNVQQRVGEADPQGIDDMIRRVRLIPSHTQPLFAPRVTIYTRDGMAHTLESTGREFIMSFDDGKKAVADRRRGPRRRTAVCGPGCRMSADRSCGRRSEIDCTDLPARSALTRPGMTAGNKAATHRTSPVGTQWR